MGAEKYTLYISEDGTWNDGSVQTKEFNTEKERLIEFWAEHTVSRRKVRYASENGTVYISDDINSDNYDKLPYKLRKAIEQRGMELRYAYGIESFSRRQAAYILRYFADKAVAYHKKGSRAELGLAMDQLAWAANDMSKWQG